MPGTEKRDRKTLFARWFQVLATFSVGAVGVYFTHETTMQQERSTVSMGAMQLMSTRENSELALRQAMFQTVAEKILNKGIDISIGQK